MEALRRPVLSSGWNCLGQVQHLICRWSVGDSALLWPAGEFARVLRPGGWLLTASQCGESQRVKRASAYGHAVTMTKYRQDAEHVVSVLDGVDFHVHVQLHRSAEGLQTTPQTVLLARRR